MNNNIFFITIDGLRADKFSGYTKTSKTPFLDNLKKQGTYFNEAISCADGTTLSLNSIFTGLYPFRTGTRAKEVYMNEFNFLHSLKKSGYHIYGIIPNFTSLSRLKFYFENSKKTFDCQQPSTGHLHQGVGNDMTDLLSSQKMKEPWFCYFHPFDLHDPLVVNEKFQDNEFGLSKYEKVLSSIDYWIKEFFEYIDLTKTISIITADHGSIIPEGDIGYSDFEPQLKFMTNTGKKIIPNFSKKIASKGLISFKEKIRNYNLKKANKGLTPYQIRSRLPYFRLTLHEEAIRVPLLFVGKNIPKNLEFGNLVSSVDIFPTLLDIVKISDLKKRDGRSLTPLFNGNTIDEKPVYLHTMPYEEISIHDKVGLRTKNFKYFRNSTVPHLNVHLYDILSDPFENNNLASNKSEIIKNMEKILYDITQNKSIDSLEPIEDERLKKIQDELRTLGYKKSWKEK